MKKLFLLAMSALFLFSCNDADNGTSSTADSLSPASASTANNNEAKEERNKQTALASVQEFANGGNVDGVLKNMDKDGIDYGEGSMAPMKGPDSTKAMLGAWMKAVPDYKGTDFMAVADGDYVMIYGTWTGTWKNDFMGMKATGKSFTVKDVDIFKFNEAGKIIEHRSVQSNNEASKQLGMPMP